MLVRRTAQAGVGTGDCEPHAMPGRLRMPRLCPHAVPDTLPAGCCNVVAAVLTGVTAPAQKSSQAVAETCCMPFHMSVCACVTGSQDGSTTAWCARTAVSRRATFGSARPSHTSPVGRYVDALSTWLWYPASCVKTVALRHTPSSHCDADTTWRLQVCYSSSRSGKVLVSGCGSLCSRMDMDAHRSCGTA